ncbi:MAG: arginine--tRNA ligase, partial [Microbacteriaceae bacterium]|nr:arginine--tRNA ligase [Microbacteriaceae bacterium]
MNPDALAALVAASLTEFAASRGAVLELTAADVPVERPKNPEHGDWASNAAMQYGKRLGVAPRELAAALVAAIAVAPGVASAEIAGPGFIN